MEVNVKTLDHVTLIELEGEIDGKTAPQAQEKVVPLTHPGAKLLLDMTKVTYMSSAGLRVLLLLYRQTSAGNGRVVLVGLSEDIKDTMSVTGFLKFFTTCDTLEAGLAVLNG